MKKFYEEPTISFESFAAEEIMLSLSGNGRIDCWDVLEDENRGAIAD